MMDRLKHFFQRFTHPKVDDREIEGVTHVINNIDHGFEPDRPRPEQVDENKREDEERV
ncbi:hypothetical protein [Martelella endophytica]|uniref:hypothetical protein n=1 Tax=Martelella endophytica TaxID=1486262 RepID=UPI000ADE166E|nr:hypothetical protein [Martelella endophytica]